MRIGEAQSQVFDWQVCLFEPNGEVYESENHKTLDKPLDTGRLFYAKLRNALPRNTTIEVYWNHFTNEITGVMAGRDFEYEVTFRDPVMARTDKVVYIEGIIEHFKEAKVLSQQ